jgi:hypothetical protein
MLRIDTHHHAILADYRNMLRKAGIDDAGGRILPDWTAEAAASAPNVESLGENAAKLHDKSTFGAITPAPKAWSSARTERVRPVRDRCLPG